MNDEELINAVRQSVGDVHMDVPAEQVVSRSHAIRTRRVISGATGALALAAGLAVAVIALVPASHPGSHQTTAGLPAWTVVKQSDGNIDITFRQLSDPAGLQSTLRGDGLPAVVDFNGQPPPGCQTYPPISSARASSIFQFPQSGRRTGGTVLIIRPSALPSGAGVQIAPIVPSPGHIHTNIDLVYATPQCTG